MTIKYLSLAIFLLFSLMIKAQGNYGTPEERANYQTDQMKKALPLHPHQIERVHQLNLKYARMVQREVIDTGMNHFSAYFYMQKLIEKKEEELFPLLSEPQIKAYLKLKSAVVKSLINRFFG
ncbi:hypothetical protein [Phaeodactylibacter xiamenensis]|jgi:hypothetical protein|uniref:hypothetical protein n=1 Tax=Phaeodactylibacter xiamenensis TaxID=1524460 RepID=UPI0024A8E59E|nr:hypothetical protein [Phaeodactylibacter xiamenensis]